MPVGTYKESFLFVLSLLVLLPVITHAQVSKIVFTTESQIIKPGELSGPITIQTQDSFGNLYQTPETIDLEFTSTSATAEFLGSTGNPVTKTMNTNTANRTFYYRDSMEGNSTITINATGRTSGNIWGANQTITISNSVSTSTSTTTNQTTTTTSTPSPTNNSPSTTSGHYSATPVTYLDPSVKFEAGAGRNRLSTVGVPIEFKADTTSEHTKNSSFKWSFGDGSMTNGPLVTHSYAYPGEYVVVLSVTALDGKGAVSRTNVKIVAAELFVSQASLDRIEITNNSREEVNLYGRALTSGGKIFLFPQDTIVAAKQKISFSTAVTGLKPTHPTDVYLVVVGASPSNINIAAKIEEERLAQIALVQSQIYELQQELVVVTEQEEDVRLSTTTEIIESEEPKVEEINKVEEKNPAELQLESQTALVTNAISETKSGIMSSWLNILKRFFFRTW
ncbi:MAG: hypothetical protein A3C70_01000 [Candidatus Zambryskibacteria bacterium RIFCSPHIGHO2_02_FULL_43_14]|uniref:PKD domain-containing protein n=1 Tax=Candidatus Zambryskibacteria bacterium RIFCSPHIGHO2_02_FULL_43_14 TaxID=1802748 RepID=A0A1G2TE72_9BACT|nr:MAG: hypothetical protein A2829_03045 [Candidatus Zambryskibacteria bacterium RIFCSPHIGHO2_01_FULL_43_60]OHA95587.1 MAG: hypothetical protein A3C70_01000 [Candidatus Zambryskibacteria bacterium RIFCSPHIGHO2_02_FULL_43_14]OHB02942.1 MAG: hypothetical protein A3B03_03440 [Candidatus Zambryskibacteria bacterium RIFCSPLOWO2_01_FULL_42_41]